MNSKERWCFADMVWHALFEKDIDWLRRRIKEADGDMREALLTLHEILSVDIVEMFFVTKNKLETDLSLTGVEKEVYELVHKVCKKELDRAASLAKSKK